MADDSNRDAAVKNISIAARQVVKAVADKLGDLRLDELDMGQAMEILHTAVHLEKIVGFAHMRMRRANSAAPLAA